MSLKQIKFDFSSIPANERDSLYSYIKGWAHVATILRGEHNTIAGTTAYFEENFDVSLLKLPDGCTYEVF
ncbi:hypothetical protein [Agathobaculum desmolans]|uniref:hypothetical protein n=1 Tax=Agathobaculum desmolans TaxID=39484 RepID=UPI0004E2559E|nr:hypothetical protein [Agathobaculum desmolans]